MIDCIKPKKIKSLLAYRDCLDSLEANCNLRSGRIPLTFQTSASVRAWEVLVFTIGQRSGAQPGKSPVSHTNVGKARDYS